MSDLEREYSPSSRVGGSSAPFVADYEARSAAAAASLGHRVEQLVGGTLLVRAEPVPAAAPGPLLVFVHGGYWQALSAAASLYLAPGALAAGWSYAAVEYTIAPEGSLPQMVDECADALRRLAERGPWTSVVLAGHSAGAHLAAMAVLVTDGPVNGPSLPIDRLVLISGVYDLRPLAHTTVNDVLGLDETSAVALSPMLQPFAASSSTSFPSVMVTWGDDDTDAFKAQGHVFAARLRIAEVDVVEFECAGRHHFDIVDALADPGSAIGGFALGGDSAGGTT